MNNARWSTYLLAILSLVFVTIGVQHSSAQVHKKHLRELESNFLPAWRQGDNLTVLTSLGKVVQRMTDDQVVELDKLLADDQMPKSAQILVEARMHLLQQTQACGQQLRAEQRELAAGTATVRHIPE